MINRNNPSLAINGGNPITKNLIVIHKPFLDETDFEYVNRAVRSTCVSGDGPDCREFERDLADYLGVKHVLFVNSATAALELAFRVKKFRSDSEVIVPDFTYTSTALGALYNNLKIKLVDVYSDNGSIDVSKIENAINKNTVAITPVDYAGIPADMDAVNSIAKKYNLYVVHDTAQSIGSSYRGKMSGNLADVSTFSFHGTKNLTTGEGGAFVTNNDEIAESVKIMREKGTDKYTFITGNITRGFYDYVDIGNSYVQSNINGALGVSQLRKISEINAKRKGIAEFYISKLKGLPGIDFLRVTEGSMTNWHIFGILVPPQDKFWIMDSLRSEGIMANIHYNPLHCNKFYRHLAPDCDMPGAMKFYGSLLRLPLYPSLSLHEQKCVVDAVLKVFNF
jgi:dTDP-4-amino-4,6-dideoxygalactose transaminase